MNVLMIASEYAPLAKTGGLADAVPGLAGALAERGHDVRVLLPKYPRLNDAGSGTRPLGRAGGAEIERLEGTQGPRVYLAEAPEFAANVNLYTGDERDAASFIRLARAALGLAHAAGWRPELLHCHDWHAALVPALREALGNVRRAETAPCLLTLHNIGYQGIFDAEVLESSGVSELAALRGETERAEGIVNFLKLGIRYADALTTVSPTYAAEIQRPEYGMGLEALLRERSADLTGILNGVDYRTWSPEADPFLDTHYSRSAPAPKRLVKRSLAADLGLPDDDAPIVACVTRLVWQKGIDVLAAALPALLERTDARFAVLGSGETGLEERLADLAARHPDRVAFKRGYDEALAHCLLAGGDFVLVPSRYEPCGLTQLYALRYGTIPIVRATGGLADTVRHFDPRTGNGNGSVFEHADVEGILWGVTTAVGWYGDPESWRKLVDNAMRADFSWAEQAPDYEALYARLVRAPGARP